MDKIQKRLMEMERESPSPSLIQNAPTLTDKLKTQINSFQRMGKVEQVQPKYHNTLTEDERQSQENLRNIYCSMINENPQKPDYEASFKKARASVMDSLRNPHITFSHGRQDNLDDSLHTLENLWKSVGYENSALPKDKLLNLRKRALKPKAKETINRFYSAMEKEGATNEDLTAPLRELREMYSTAGSSFNTDGLWNRMLKEYPEKAPYVPVSEALQQHQGNFIIHGVPADYTNGSLQNNHCIDPSKKQTWEDFLRTVIDEKPTLSCSSVTNKSAPTEMYSRIGVILNEGRIQNARPSDGATITYSPEIKLVQGSSERGTLREKIGRAITGKTDKYNELIVANPETQGLYFTDGITRLGNITHTSGFLGTEEKNQAAISNLAEIAISRGLPLYKFSQGTGFKRVNPRDYTSANAETLIV